MNEISKPISTAVPLATGTPVNITLPGEGNTLVAHANEVDMRRLYVSTAPTSGVPLPKIRTINGDYYSLFVIGDELFNRGHFTVPKEFALTESIAPELKAKYAKLDMDAIAAIKTFPALFASKNHQYCRAGENQVAYLGFVDDVIVQDNGIKVFFYLLYAVHQSRLNELTSVLSIDSASAFNEFDRTHWTIKQINLMGKLRKMGLINTWF